MSYLKEYSIKTIFVNVVSTIFQIILFIGNFLGLLYILEGNVAFAFTGSILLTVLYIFLIQLLVEYKEIMYKNLITNRRPHFSLILWVFYFGLASMSAYLLAHFVNVEYNAKEYIQSTAKNKLDVVSNAIKIYDERSSSAMAEYTAEFRTELYNYKTTGNKSTFITLTNPPFSLDPSSIAVYEKIDINKMANAHLEPITSKIDSNKAHISQKINENNKEYEKVFRNWKRLEVVQTYKNLNDYVEQTTNTINTKIADLPLANDKISFSFNKDVLPLSNPKKLANYYPPNYLVPILVILIIHLFLILPFIFHTIRKYGGGGNEKIFESSEETNMKKQIIPSTGSKEI